MQWLVSLWLALARGCVSPRLAPPLPPSSTASSVGSSMSDQPSSARYSYSLLSGDSPNQGKLPPASRPYLHQSEPRSGVRRSGRRTSPAPAFFVGAQPAQSTSLPSTSRPPASTRAESGTRSPGKKKPPASRLRPTSSTSRIGGEGKKNTYTPQHLSTSSRRGESNGERVIFFNNSSTQPSRGQVHAPYRAPNQSPQPKGSIV